MSHIFHQDAQRTSVHSYWPAADWHLWYTVQVYSQPQRIYTNLLWTRTHSNVVLFSCYNYYSLAAAVSNVYVAPSTKRFRDVTHLNGPSADKAGRPCSKRFRDDYSLQFKESSAQPSILTLFMQLYFKFIAVRQRAACSKENDDTHA